MLPTLMELCSQYQNVQELALNLPLPTDQEVKEIEQCTRGQSNNNNWKLHRVGRITASTIHRVLTKVNSLKKNSNSDVEPLLNNLVDNMSDTSYIPSLQYGREMEDIARDAYIKELKQLKHKDVNVQECGLFIAQNRFYIAASPDGLVNCSCCGMGLLEIKCPSSIANQIPNENNLNYLQKSSLGISLKKTHQYYSQIQTQMAVTGRPWCDFFVYTNQGSHLERFMFDQNHWQQLAESADYFFVHCLAPKLLSLK